MKDEVEYEAPSDWDFIKKNKNRFLLGIEEYARYEHVILGKCVAPCVKHPETSVVSIQESECFTNCISRGLHTRAIFESLHVSRDAKEWKEFKNRK